MRKVAAVLLALALAGAACGREPAAAPGGPRRLRVATEAAYPPFELVQEDGTIAGFDVDIVRAAAREAGMEAEFVNQKFDGIIPGVRGGRYDAAVSAMTITEERAREVAFTDPYFDAGLVVAVREGQEGIRGPSDLAGRVVAVQRGTTGDLEASKLGAKEVRRFDATEPAFLELLAGRADAVINDAPSTALYMGTRAGLRIAGEVFTKEQYGIAVRRDDPDLLARLNEGLRKARASGEYARIRAKWFGGK